MSGRLTAVDRLRGLIMVLMAIDHASYFIARVHASEGWADVPQPATVTRWITHLCAPGFFMLMGAGMVWLAKARQRDGWSHARIRRFFVTRGAALFFVQHVVENPAWLLGSLSVSAALPPIGLPPGGGTEFFLHFGVISALGVGLIFWGLLIELPSLVVLAVGGLAMVASVAMTPEASQAATLFAPWRLLLFTPSHTNAINVLYPWVPWLAPAGLGILVGRLVARRPAGIAASSAVLGTVLLALWTGLTLGGNGVFLKYPPTPAFLALMLGLDALLLAAFALSAAVRMLAPLEVFGRSPLFFYLLHLWVFGLLSFAFPTGTSMPFMYLTWAVAVAAMYPACGWYARFKAAQPATSMWRLF